MPLIKSAIKRARQALVRRDRNQSTKKDVKTAVKAFQTKPSASSLSKAQSAIDTAVKKNLLNARTAARRKAALSKEAKAAGVKPATSTKKKTATATAKKSPAKKTPAKKASPAKAAAKKPAAKK